MSTPLGPVELEFTIDRDVDTRARDLKKAIDNIGVASQKSQEALKATITEQKRLIANIDQDIKDIEKQLSKTAPGLVQITLEKELKAAKRALEEEKGALQGMDAELKKTSQSTQGLLTLKRQLTEELVRLEAAGKRGTAEYDVIAKKLGELTDRMGDAATQARVLAHDNAALQGVISGISGLSGAMSAGAGVVGLFAGESENLVKIQTRVQSLMAITIGLQQTANVLNKDSAFRIITVTRAKKAWAATVETLNTQLKLNISLSKLMVATGIGIIIAAVTALIALYSRWKQRQEEVNKVKKEFQEISKESAINVAKEKVEVQALLKVADNYNASLSTRNKAIERLRQIMPGYNGYINKEGELVDNSTEALKNYLSALVKVERAKQLINKQKELEARLTTMEEDEDLGKLSFSQRARLMLAQVGNAMSYRSGDLGTGFLYDEQYKKQVRENKDKAIEIVKTELEQYNKELNELLSDDAVFLSLFGATGGGQKEYDATADLHARLLELQRKSSQLLFDQKKDDIARRLEMIDREHEEELSRIEEFHKQVINKYNEANKDKPGFKPLSTEQGKLQAGIATIDPEVAKQYEESIAILNELYAKKKINIQKEAAEQVKQIFRDITDSFLSEQETELIAVREKYEKIREEVIRLQGSISEQQELLLQSSQKKAEQLINDTWFLKTSDAFLRLFGDIERMSTRALEQAIETAKQIVEEKKDILSPKDLESYVNAITRAENEVRARNPFKTLIEDIKKYQKEVSDVAKKDILKQVFGDTAESINMVSSSIDSIIKGLDDLGLLSQEQKDIATQISGLLSGAQNLAMGIATNNPMQIIQGSIDMIVNGIKLFDKKTREIERNINLTRQQIEELSRAYNQLERATEKALGTERFEAQKNQIKNLQQQILEYQKLIEQESRKSKKKQDESAIIAAREAIQQAQNQIEDIYQDIFELVTQTNAKALADDLADALVDAFMQGRDAAEVFEQVSTRVLQNAVKNALKMQLLEKPIQDAVKRLQSKMGTFDAEGVFQFDGLSPQEAEAFKNEITQIGQAYSDALGQLKFLFDQEQLPDTSLSGSIKSITESTASVLAGQINAIRINQSETRDMIRQQLLHVAEIAANTSYNRHLEEIRDILKYNTDNNSTRAQGI